METYQRIHKFNLKNSVNIITFNYANILASGYYLFDI